MAEAPGQGLVVVEEEPDQAGRAREAAVAELGPAGQTAAAAGDPDRESEAEEGALGRAGQERVGVLGLAQAAAVVAPDSSPCPIALRPLARVHRCPVPGEEQPGRRRRRPRSHQPR